MSRNHAVSSSPEHAAVPLDHATVQKVGYEFVMDYFGRLNNTGRVQSVANMFADHARFSAMDVPNSSRSAVGRADAVGALRRFCRTYGGGNKARRSITVVSVDTRVDDCDCDCGRDGDRYELFVYAEWTMPVADTCAPPTPFVQTFLVRRPRDAVGAASDRPLEILRTTVKVIPSQQPNFADDKIHSGSEKNVYTSPKIQSNNKNISSYKNQLNDKDNQSFSVDNNVTATVPVTANPAAAAVFSKPSATSTRFSYGGESSGTQRSFGMQSAIPGRKPPHKRMNQYREFETYQKRVETFLKGSSGDDHQNTRPARLCVDGLDASFTANDLYAAFGRFGTVLWVRIMPADNDVRTQAVTTKNRRSSGPVRRVGHVCFERSEDLSRAMAEQHRYHGCVIRGTRMSVRMFDQ